MDISNGETVRMWLISADIRGAACNKQGAVPVSLDHTSKEEVTLLVKGLACVRCYQNYLARGALKPGFSRSEVT